MVSIEKCQIKGKSRLVKVKYQWIICCLFTASPPQSHKMGVSR